MARSTALWVGKTDDSPIPPRVRDRVFDRHGGRCHKCTRVINAKAGETWTCEHVIAIINGGRNAEDNLACTCDNCLPIKNAEDAAIKKKSTQIRYRSRGIKPKTSQIRSIGFSKAGAKYSRARGLWIDTETGEPLNPQPT